MFFNFASNGNFFSLKNNQNDYCDLKELQAVPCRSLLWGPCYCWCSFILFTFISKMALQYSVGLVPDRPTNKLSKDQAHL